MSEENSVFLSYVHHRVEVSRFWLICVSSFSGPSFLLPPGWVRRAPTPCFVLADRRGVRGRRCGPTTVGEASGDMKGNWFYRSESMYRMGGSGSADNRVILKIK